MTNAVPIVFADAHAYLSPSSSSRWIPCPGSVAAQAVAGGHDEPNVHSLLGVHAHSLLEVSLRFGTPPHEFIGQSLEAGHEPVTEEMADAVSIAYEYVLEYLETYGAENVVLHIERRVVIGPALGVPEEKCNGTTDVMLLHRDLSCAVVIDYKHGSGVRVDAKENPQLMLYSSGARLAVLPQKFKRYRNVIIQPRASKRYNVEEWEYTDAMLNRFLKDTAGPSARAALLPNAPRSAGSHCRFCRAASNCRTYHKKALSIAGSEFDAVEDMQDAEAIPVEELPSILKQAKVVEDWVKAIRHRALKILEDGGAIEGYKLGWGKRIRKWEDTAAVMQWCEKHNLLKDEYAPRDLLSPAQLTKLIKHRGMLARKLRGDTKDPINPLDAFVTYSIPKPAVVEIGDSEFDTVDETQEP